MHSYKYQVTTHMNSSPPPHPQSIDHVQTRVRKNPFILRPDPHQKLSVLQVLKPKEKTHFKSNLTIVFNPSALLTLLPFHHFHRGTQSLVRLSPTPGGKTYMSETLSTWVMPWGFSWARRTDTWTLPSLKLTYQARTGKWIFPLEKLGDSGIWNC